MLLLYVQMAIEGGIQAGMQVGGQVPAAYLNLPRFQVSPPSHPTQTCLHARTHTAYPTKF